MQRVYISVVIFLGYLFVVFPLLQRFELPDSLIFASMFVFLGFCLYEAIQIGKETKNYNKTVAMPLFRQSLQGRSRTYLWCVLIFSVFFLAIDFALVIYGYLNWIMIPFGVIIVAPFASACVSKLQETGTNK